jgi:hypothetical protein
MTWKELKELLNQIPEYRLDEPAIFTCMGKGFHEVEGLSNGNWSVEDAINKGIPAERFPDIGSLDDNISLLY